MLSVRSVRSAWLGSRVVSVLDSGAEGPGFKSQAAATLSGNSLRQTIHTQFTPLFHEAAKLVAALLRVAGITAVMAAYRRVYDSRHLQADCQEPGSASEPYARSSSMGYLYPLPQLDLNYTTYIVCSVCSQSVRSIGRCDVTEYYARDLLHAIRCN